ncbi:hypothetical protein FNF28_07490 [Cafeteria roenbergensis]|uniref:Guanylate cyclase domain-containing protein n=1 Tax=Cafeteria roenbergensis TaxID=33653 RepID=A0A5A8C5F5_CAFRO|nr:hypothetical protein FNF28_07490 [Cafeteria roenbergensis]
METAQGFRFAQMLSRVAGELLDVPPDEALIAYRYMSDPVTARCTNHFIRTMEKAYLMPSGSGGQMGAVSHRADGAIKTQRTRGNDRSVQNLRHILEKEEAADQATRLGIDGPSATGHHGSEGSAMSVGGERMGGRRSGMMTLPGAASIEDGDDDRTSMHPEARSKAGEHVRPRSAAEGRSGTVSSSSKSGVLARGTWGSFSRGGARRGGAPSALQASSSAAASGADALRLSTVDEVSPPPVSAGPARAFGRKGSTTPDVPRSRKRDAMASARHAAQAASRQAPHTVASGHRSLSARDVADGRRARKPSRKQMQSASATWGRSQPVAAGTRGTVKSDLGSLDELVDEGVVDDDEDDEDDADDASLAGRRPTFPTAATATRERARADAKRRTRHERQRRQRDSMDYLSVDESDLYSESESSSDSSTVTSDRVGFGSQAMVAHGSGNTHQEFPSRAPFSGKAASPGTSLRGGVIQTASGHRLPGVPCARWQAIEEWYWGLDPRFDDEHTEAVFQALRMRRTYRSVRGVLPVLVVMSVALLALASLALFKYDAWVILPLVTGVGSVLAMLRVIQRHSREFSDSPKAGHGLASADGRTPADSSHRHAHGADDELEDAIAGAAGGEDVFDATDGMFRDDGTLSGDLGGFAQDESPHEAAQRAMNAERQRIDGSDVAAEVGLVPSPVGDGASGAAASPAEAVFGSKVRASRKGSPVPLHPGANKSWASGHFAAASKDSQAPDTPADGPDAGGLKRRTATAPPGASVFALRTVQSATLTPAARILEGTEIAASGSPHARRNVALASGSSGALSSIAARQAAVAAAGTSTSDMSSQPTGPIVASSGGTARGGSKLAGNSSATTVQGYADKQGGTQQGVRRGGRVPQARRPGFGFEGTSASDSQGPDTSERVPTGPGGSAVGSSIGSGDGLRRQGGAAAGAQNPRLGSPVDSTGSRPPIRMEAVAEAPAGTAGHSAAGPAAGGAAAPLSSVRDQAAVAAGTDDLATPPAPVSDHVAPSSRPGIERPKLDIDAMHTSGSAPGQQGAGREHPAWMHSPTGRGPAAASPGHASLGHASTAPDPSSKWSWRGNSPANQRPNGVVFASRVDQQSAPVHSFAESGGGGSAVRGDQSTTDGIGQLHSTRHANARSRARVVRRGAARSTADVVCAWLAARCGAVASRVPGCKHALEADAVLAGLVFMLHTSVCCTIVAKEFLGYPSIAPIVAAMGDGGLNDPLTGGSGTAEQASLLSSQAACVHSVPVPLVFMFALPLLPFSSGAMATLSLGGALSVLVARAIFGLLDPTACLPAELAATVLMLFVPLFFAVFDAAGQESQDRHALLQRLASRRAKTQADGVLEQLLPTHVNEKLRRNEPVPFEIHPNDVVMLWADLVGFTALSSSLKPHQVMAILNALYSRFDALVERAHLWKVDTIGDAYVIIGGLVDSHQLRPGEAPPRSDMPGPELVERLFGVATSMREQVRAVAQATGQDIGIRIGIHSGPVATGIIGTLRPRWHVFGPTVLEAEHMESEGRRSWIQVSEAAFRLYNMRGFSLVERVRHPEAVVRPTPPVNEYGEPLAPPPQPRIALPPVDEAALPGPLPKWLDAQEAAEAAVEAREAEAAAANGGRHWVRPPRMDGAGAIWSFWLHPNEGPPAASAVPGGGGAGAWGGPGGGNLPQSHALPPSPATAAANFGDALALPPYLTALAPPIDPMSDVATRAVTTTHVTQAVAPPMPPAAPSAAWAPSPPGAPAGAMQTSGPAFAGANSPLARALASMAAAGGDSTTGSSPPGIEWGAHAPQPAARPRIEAPAPPSGPRVPFGGSQPAPSAAGAFTVPTIDTAASQAGQPKPAQLQGDARAARDATAPPATGAAFKARDHAAAGPSAAGGRRGSGPVIGPGGEQLRPAQSSVRMFLQQGTLANVAPGHLLAASRGTAGVAGARGSQSPEAAAPAPAARQL